MKSFKRYLILIAASVVFCFAGCKGSSNEPEEPFVWEGTVWRSDAYFVENTPFPLYDKLRFMPSPLSSGINGEKTVVFIVSNEEGTVSGNYFTYTTIGKDRVSLRFNNYNQVIVDTGVRRGDLLIFDAPPGVYDGGGFPYPVTFRRQWQ